ncbi:MAG: hypothetical protein ABI132_02615 [Rhodanobacteraceae bacterium]
MTRHNRFTLSALTIALSVSALGVAPTRTAFAADAPAAPPDACKVLSAKDAQPLLKKPIVKTGPLFAGTGCRFETANGSYVDIETGYGAVAQQFVYPLGHTGPQGPPATLPLAGIGDKAKMAKNGNGVVAVKGQVSCGASEGGIDWPEQTEPARQKAQAQQLGALCNKFFAAH